MKITEGNGTQIQISDGQWELAVCSRPGADVLLVGRPQVLDEHLGCGNENCRSAWRSALAGGDAVSAAVIGATAAPEGADLDAMEAYIASSTPRIAEAMREYAAQHRAAGTDLDGAMAALAADPWLGNPPTGEEIAALTGGGAE